MKIRYMDEYYGESVKDLSGSIKYLRGTKGEPGEPGSVFHDSTLTGTGSTASPLSVSKPIPNGMEGQMITFDAAGNPIAINIPQTNSVEILEKLKEVDTNSSGLNADLVHGVRGSRIEKVVFLGSLKNLQTIGVGWSSLDLVPIFDPQSIYSQVTKTFASSIVAPPVGITRRYVVKIQMNMGSALKDGISKIAIGYKNASTKHIIDVSRASLDEIITATIDTPKLSFIGSDFNGINLDSFKVFNSTGFPIVLANTQDNQLMCDMTTFQISYYDLL